MAPSHIMLSALLFCFYTAESQFHPHRRPTVSPNANITSVLPTPSPTPQLFPCDYIDPVINSSNCGICVMNDSCTWCTSDRTCHVRSTYDESQCDSGVGAITGSDHLFHCCETASTCQQCTTLYKVECDWCITSKTCFNSSDNIDCDDGNENNGKEIIFKDGVCRDDPHKTFWDKLKDYYLQIPIVFRCILITLSSLCLILLCICLCLCTKNKLNKRKLNKKYKRIQQQRNINNSKAPDYLAYSEPKE